MGNTSNTMGSSDSSPNTGNQGRDIGAIQTPTGLLMNLAGSIAAHVNTADMGTQIGKILTPNTMVPYPFNPDTMNPAYFPPILPPTHLLPHTTISAGAWVPTAAEKTYEAANPTYTFDPARPWTLPAMEDWVALQKSVSLIQADHSPRHT